MYFAVSLTSLIPVQINMVKLGSTSIAGEGLRTYPHVHESEIEEIPAPDLRDCLVTVLNILFDLIDE